MRNLYCLLLAICFAVSASAQKVYFIYLQTDNNVPFYVKMNDRIYSSATSGYLILSNLVDSTYHFSIGFPSSQTESKFTVPVTGKDNGFIIKNFESGLGLFDWQSLSVIRAQKEDTQTNISYERRNDDFSSLLSKAARDTSLLYKAIVIKQDVAVQKEPVVENNSKAIDEGEKSKGDGVPSVKDSLVSGSSETDLVQQPVKHEDSASLVKLVEKTTIDSLAENPELNNTAIENKDTNIIKETTSPVVNNEVFRRSVVKKHSESSTSEGFGLVFYDNYDKGVDTIRLLIPNPKFTFRQAEVADSSKDKAEFIHLSEIKEDTVSKLAEPAPDSRKVAVKANCKSVATEKDFFKLRKNMAAEETDEGMVDEAKKVFKGKCFTTEQIKNLSALFLTSAGKYQFFDAAYLHVTDQEQFSSLQSEIKDDYYLRRFKALVGE